MASKILNRDVPEYMVECWPFENKNGTLRGVALYRSTHTMSDLSFLPREWQVRLDAELQTWGELFVVFSYNTPIAWTLGGARGVNAMGYTIPDIRYSTTTSRHQSLCNQANHLIEGMKSQRYRL